jgi:hypothetical protein
MSVPTAQQLQGEFQGSPKVLRTRTNDEARKVVSDNHVNSKFPLAIRSDRGERFGDRTARLYKAGAGSIANVALRLGSGDTRTRKLPQEEQDACCRLYKCPLGPFQAKVANQKVSMAMDYNLDPFSRPFTSSPSHPRSKLSMTLDLQDLK